MEKKIGIWIDKSKAYVIDAGSSSLEIIESEVESFRSVGGSPGSSPYGNQDAGGEKELQERQRNQLKKYVDKVSDKISDASKVVIFGPAETKLELKKSVESKSALKSKLVGVETADSMSETSLVEWVKNYYN
jgi:hypothetical protein